MGFNGKENDREWGGQLIQDYGFRLYNLAIGKFLSVDPLSSEYPWNSTYAFAENDVIRCIDLDGLEKFSTTLSKEYKERYPHFHQLIESGHLNQNILNSPKTLEVLSKYTVGMLTAEQVKKDIGSGPFMYVATDVFYNGHTGLGKHESGATKNTDVTIKLNVKLVQAYEDAMNGSNEPLKVISLVRLYDTFINEYTHYGDILDGFDAIKDNAGNIINSTVAEEPRGYFEPTEFDEGNEAAYELFGGGSADNNKSAHEIYINLEKGLQTDPSTGAKAPIAPDHPRQQDATIIPEVPKTIKK